MYLIDNYLFNCNSRNCIIDNGIDQILNDCSLNDINLDNIIVFGLKIKLDKISLKTIQHLFAIIRKYSDYSKNLALTINEFMQTNNDLNIDWIYLRKEIVYALSLFKYLICKSSSTTIEIKKSILNEFKHLLLSINRLSNLPEHILNATIQHTSTNQLFHLHLDIWWNIYQIFKYADPLLKDDVCLIRDKSFPSADLLNQFRNILLADLITISLIKFNINHLNASLSSLHRNSDAFTCNCIKLIYVLIYLDYQNETQNDNLNPFWINFNKILDLLITHQHNEAINQQIESVKHFQWINRIKNLDKNGQFASLWLISSLADLYQNVNIEQFNQSKQLKQLNNFKFQDNNLYVCNIIKRLISKLEDGPNEIDTVQLLSVLKLCFKLSRNWNLSIEIVLIFFDFFMKNLNTPLQLNNNIKNMQMLPKTSFIWYQKLILLDKFDLTTLDNEENVNQLIYFLVYSFVKKSVDDHSTTNHFQKFKGRLYSKLQAKKIEEFKDIGLFNLLNTFMVTSFASKNNSIDLLNKFVFIIKIVKNKSLYSSRMILVFRSLFCFNYFLTKNEDLKRLNEIIVELFNEICESIPNWSLNNIQISSVHNAYFELVNVFCNEVLEYLKNAQTANDEFKNVFKCKFNLLLHKLSEREELSILQFTNNIINEIKCKLEDDEFNFNLSFYANIYELINKQFKEFLKGQMQSKSFNSQISEVIYEFIYLNILLSQDTHNFKCLIDDFLFKKTSNMLNLCELFVKIVDCDTVFSKFLDVYYDSNFNIEKELMKLWFQISITIKLPDDKFDKLTRKLAIQFPIFESSNTNLLAIQDVFINLVRKYQQQSTNQDKVKLRTDLNECLNAMLEQGKNMLKEESTSEESFNQLYTILSYLVLNCCPIIYIQGNNYMVLPLILETFINPNFIQTLSTSRSQIINNCIRKTLPKFLIGLSTLYKSNDPYIDRKLKIMFITYIPLFLTKNSTHIVLIELIQNRTSQADLFFLLLHYIKDSLFIRTNTNPALTIQLIQFLNEFYLCVKNHTEQQNQLFKLFPSFLDKMLTSEELTKRKIRDYLTLMVNNSKHQLGDENLNKNLIEYYENFIKKNSNNLIRVIKVLEFTLPFCLLIRERLISILMYTIKQIEDSSSGIDDLLRNCFQQFINKLSN